MRFTQSHPKPTKPLNVRTGGRRPPKTLAVAVGIATLLITVSSAQVLTTLHSFTAFSGNVDGIAPTGGLVLLGDFLYGTASQGGSNAAGTVFVLKNDGTAFRTLHTFNSLLDGADPEAGLLLSGDTLFGTTMTGGDYARRLDNGTVFALKTNGLSFKILHYFSRTSGSADTNRDGGRLRAGLIISGNTLYGDTYGGGVFGNGSIFKLNTDGSSFTNLHSLIGLGEGGNPYGNLVLLGNVLYGTASDGGISGGSSGPGTLFAVNTDGTAFTNLYDFPNNSDGANPYPAALIYGGGALYGSTTYGGSRGDGTLFAIDTETLGYRIVHSFAGAPNDGDGPFQGGLVLAGNILYGVTDIGGTSDIGTVFAVNTDGTGFTILHSFGGSDGARPSGNLVLSGNTIYGTTRMGGDFGHGTVFSLSPVPVPTILPELKVIRSSSNLFLTWPTNATGFTLQCTTNLVPPIIWTAVAPAPVTVDGQNIVSNSISGSQRFYRLSQ